MSTCISMQGSPNFGLDWTSPFQIGCSSFILLSCQPPISSLTTNASPICDPSNNHLCNSIYTCPAVVALGLPLFPPTNTCCAYSPANLNDKGELDLRSLKCGAYASVLSLGDNPTDPTHRVYGVSLKYSDGALDDNVVSSKCNGCEISGPETPFICVCKGGYNTRMDCFSSYNEDQGYIWGSDSSPLLTHEFLFLFLFKILFVASLLL